MFMDSETKCSNHVNSPHIYLQFQCDLQAISAGFLLLMCIEFDKFILKGLNIANTIL